MSDLENLVFNTLDRIVNQVLGGQPNDTGGRPLNPVVYSHLAQGVMIDPETYRDPWVPVGPLTALTPAAVPEINRGIYAAWRTAELTNDMLQITPDNTYAPYPGGRHLDAQYKGIIDQMEVQPPPPVPTDVQQRRDAADKLLHQLDAEGNIIGNSKILDTYLANAAAYSTAQSAFTLAQIDAQHDPIAASFFPQTAVPLKAAVDRAWDLWKTEGADKVEEAIATLEAAGKPITEAMKAKALRDYAAWDLVLAGVPVGTQYTALDPPSWCKLSMDNIGWQTLHVTSQAANSYVASSEDSFAKSYVQSHSSSTSGGGQVGYAFVFVGADAGSGDSSGGWGSTSSADSSHVFHNDGSDFELQMQWGTVRVQRPWLNTDLLALPNWYMPGQRKGCVSNGTTDAASQRDSLMPMVPTEFVVIRNVRISSSNWGSDGQTLSALHDSSHGDYHASTSSYGGSAGVSLGFVTFGGHVSHSESDAASQLESQHQSGNSSQWGWHFDGATLTISGAQIVGWVSNVLPPCPMIDDPHLPAQG